MQPSTLNLDRLINVNNVKYVVLSNIIGEAFKGSNAEEIDIYIDMNSLLKVLFSGLKYTIDDYSVLTTCFINMAAHYRTFFRKYPYRVHSRIYFVFSMNNPYINGQFVQGYNKMNVDKWVKDRKTFDMIQNNLKLLEILCPYLEDIYYIPTAFETGVAIYDLMCRQDKENKNGHLIITKDPYNYQLVNMAPQTAVLRTKKDDASYYINTSNLYERFCAERGVNILSKIISPDLFTAILALNGMKERNINTLLNINKVSSAIEEAILDKRILNMYNNSVEALWYGIAKPDWGFGINEFTNRFKAIDIQFQHILFMASPESQLMEQRLTNLYDPEAVKEINNHYFKSNPLDLNRL